MCKVYAASIFTSFIIACFIRAVFFNLGSAEPTGSAKFLQGFVRILKLALFLVSWFRQKFNNVSKVPRLEKGLKALH